MRLLFSLALAAAIAAPVAAQEQAPPEQQATPGLVVVGHGPDVPNVGAQPEAVQVPTVVVPMMVIVAVPVLVQPSHPRHHRANVVPSADAPPNPTGQFINDPSRRFINDPSPRFINPAVRTSPPQN